MNKTDLYGNAKFPIRNQTEDSGTQINSIYIKNRHDRWDRSNRGAIANFNWDIGDRSRLSLRGGHTEETFHNNQVYWGVRAYQAACSSTTRTTATVSPTRWRCPIPAC